MRAAILKRPGPARPQRSEVMTALRAGRADAVRDLLPTERVAGLTQQIVQTERTDIFARRLDGG